MAATILLVDPDVSNRTDWEALLSNCGYKVFSAGTGNAALAQCSEVQPDLILLEDPLPDISSTDFCRQLKVDPITNLTPIVMILPSSDAADVSRSVSECADDVWARPASRWEAIHRVQALLHLRTYIDRQAESVAFSLARSLDARDGTTSGHSERVREYAARLGESLGLTADQHAALRLASIVHDIGKIAVPDSILFKPGPLTSAEMEVVRQHPVVGESICAPLKAFRDALPIIRHHHERMDGTGYPDGLDGTHIPLVARIAQIADVYDALTSDRPYRKAMSPKMALVVLGDEASRGWLDGFLVEEFTAICGRVSFPLRRDASMVADYHA